MELGTNTFKVIYWLFAVSNFVLVKKIRFIVF